MQVFAQMTKVDVAKRLVFGIAAQEVADHSGEIMDYAKSKPNFQKWSDEMAKATDGASMGNIRAMHGNVAAGKMTDMSFNDAEKSISICAKVVDDNEWQKVLEGVYTGFSMGGKYGERWQDGVLKRYEAIPAEISLVDRPCIPTAKFFDIQKADGSMEKMAFKEPVAPAAAAEIEYQVDGTESDIQALGKMLNENGLTVADAVTALAKSLEKPAPELTKSLYDVSRVSDMLQSAYYLTMSATSETAREGDASPIPARLKAVTLEIASIFKDMAVEETDELLAELVAGDDNAMAMSHLAIDLIKAGARNSKGDAAMIQKMHDLSITLGAGCDSANTGKTVAVKADGAADLAKADEPTELQKAINSALEPLNKALSDAQAEIKMLKAQPLPAKGVLRVMGKAEDITPIVAADAAPALVKNADGTENAAASAIKDVLKKGGVPVMG